MCRKACFIVGMLGCAMAAPAHAQDNLSREQISFQVADAFEAGAAVAGELRIPASKHPRAPAVVILHSSPGFDGRGAFYAEALNDAGIATVEIDYLQGKGIPATPRHNLPHVYQTMQRLAAHPRIDPARIGVMGFSWGGSLALLTSSDELTRQYGKGSQGFAAHLGVYPICWKQGQIIRGTSKDFTASVYRAATGRPVHIMVGAEDDGDRPDACQQFLAALPAPVRRNFSLTVYPGATFGWDSRFGSATYLPGVRQGRGGIMKVTADPHTADKSRALAVAFFKTHLAAD